MQHYVAQALEMNDKDLQQHMCHVCAWVVFAQPPTDAAKYSGDRKLSPVRTLTMMLGLRKRKKLSDRLWAALRAVKAVCNSVLHPRANLELENYGSWQRLRNHLPSLRKRPRLESGHYCIRFTIPPRPTRKHGALAPELKGSMRPGRMVFVVFPTI